MSHFGTNCRQINANMGILFEAEFNNATYRINYTWCDKWLLQYKKVKYDPLLYTEANQCFLDLLHKVHKAIDNFVTNDRLGHGDLWLPNICFNDHFDVVLIDLDCTQESESICQD